MTAQKAKVWYNKGGQPGGNPYWKEEFKGDTIKIKNNDFIEMDWMEAVEFKGQMPRIKLNADGGVDSQYEKRITVELPPVEARFGGGPGHLCQACGDSFTDTHALAQHIAKHHLGSLADSETAEAVKTTARRGRPPKGL